MSDYFKKRMEELGLSNTEDSSNKKTNSNNSNSTKSNYFSERLKALGLDGSSNKVDDSYINSFVKDAQSHLDSSNLSGDISSAYASWKDRDKELRERESAIRYYLENNKNSLTEESYNSLKGFLDDFGMYSAQFSYSLYDAKRKANINPFDSMTSEDVRTEWDKVKAANEKTEKEYTERRQSITDELYMLRMMRRGGVTRELEDKIRALEAELVTLDNEYKQPHEIAYTTQDGRNVTWEKLYNSRKSAEDAEALYASLSSSDDWKQFVNQGASIKNPTYDDATNGVQIGKWHFGGEEVGNIVTFSRDNYNDIMVSRADRAITVGNALYKWMTNEEVEIYNYYLAKNGKDKADEYLKTLEDSLEERETSNALENIAKFAAEHPVSASVMSVGSSLVSGLEFVTDSVNQLFTGEEQHNISADTSSKIRGTVMEGTDLNIGDFDAFDFIYGTGMSMADSVSSMVMFGGLGGVNLGLSAAGQSYNDAINRGMSADQALKTAMVAGVAEGLFETVSIGKFKALQESGKAGLKDIALDFAKLAVTNASEETFTEIANIAYDILANGNFSQYETSVRQYMNAGLSEEEARKQAGKDLNAQIIEAGASGALMGFGFGAFNAVSKTAGKAYSTIKGDIQAGKNMISAADAAENYDSISALKSLAYEMAGEKKSFADKNLAKNAGKIDYTNLKARQVGKTQRLLSESISNKNAADVKAALVESGVSEKVASRITNSLAENGIAGLMAEMQKLDLADRTRVEDVIGKVSDPTSSVNVRNQRLEAAEQGVYTPDAAPKAIEQATPEVLKGEHKVSESGKTLYKNENGEYEEVNTLKIVSTEGDVKVELDNGKTVSAKDLELSSDTEAMAFEMVTRMETTPETAQIIFEAVKASDATSAQELFLSVPTAYRYGKINYEAGLKGLRIPDAIKQLAFDRGRNDAATSPKGEKKAVAKQTKNGKAKKGDAKKTSKIIFEDGVEYSEDSATEMQKSSMKGVELLSKLVKSLELHVFASWEENGERYAIIDGVKRKAPNGYFKKGTNKIYIDINAGNKGEGSMLYTLGHEVTHFIKAWNAAGFKKLGDFLIKNFGETNVPLDRLIAKKKEILIESYKRDGKELPSDNQLYMEAYEEVVADSMVSMFTDPSAYEKLAELKQQNKQGWEKLKEAIKSVLDKLKSLLNVYKDEPASTEEARYVEKFSKDVYDKLQDLYLNAFVEADANYQASNLVSIDTASKSVSPQFSERTWSASEYVTEREATAKSIAQALGVDIKTAYKYIDDINGVARLIADDRVRLDYDPNLDDKASVLKPNSEYKFSVDMSTLCAKRLLFTGTFDAIQKALPNTVFDSEDIVSLREMMQKRGYEVACGICYVESTRREIGRITQEFIDRYKEAQKTGKPISRINSSGKEVVLKSAGRTFSADKNYTPNLGELNTTDIDIVKRDHRKVYDAYLAFMNARGQAKPKLLETRAEYKGEILKHFKAKSAVEARNNAGGLRLQSFSDFEVPHMIDMMQIVMDMSRVGLKSQAYTKVPAFAEVFGDSGVKINLSLIAKGDGLDSKGNLVFDDVEGINHAEAFKLRDKYSKNVGTILVGKTDAHIKAAMADPRIDYIIPFHKSSWKESLYDALGLTGYADYTDFQNEKPIDKDRKISNFDPSEYWDFSKTGDENAQIYLEKCREDGRIPKFSQFQGYTGYWKLLIDFKMYDNDGVGSPQEVVKPVFNTEASERILNAYEGGHKSFPVAKDVVEDFVKEHKSKGNVYSERESDYQDKDPYSYESFVSKPNMKLTTLDSNAPNNRADIVAEAKKNAAKVGKFNPKDGSVSVHVDDIGVDVVLGADGLKHGLRRKKGLQNNANAIVTLKAGEILKRSIRINELIPSKANATGSYVLVGAGRNPSGDLYIVRSVVNQFTNELTSMDVLYAINAKKEGLVALNAPRSTAMPLSVTNPDISIAQLLDFVNKYFPDILPESVLRHYGYDARPEGDLGQDVLYSERTSYAPTFYSYMGKVVDDIRLAKMGAGGVVSYLKGKGVKDEEIKWSGIEAFLEGKKSVTKQELQEFVAGNQLQIDEEMSGEDIDLRYDGSNRAYNLYDENGNVIDTFTYSEFLDGYVSESDEEIYGSEISLREALREEYEKADSPRWADYRIDGGSNYRELVFKMPNSSYSNQAMRTHWGEYAEGVLAHARIQDMTTSDGKKMLFIEEIQSDWHNEGAEKGYQSSDIQSKIDALGAKADELFFKVEDYSTEMTGLAGEWETIEKTPKGAKLIREFRAADKAYKKAMDAEIHGIEDAPFHTTYHEYVLKRLLRMAAEEGYDSIGWTTAEMQADRWSEVYAEGYRIEYDQDIPKFLRKYGKKWGATVGHTAINDSANVWSMDITDSMTESVLYEGQVMYSERVTDQETIDFLENQEHITTYKSFVEIDGKLYSPMATKVKGDDGKYRLTNPSEIGAWQQAEEKPDSIQKFHKSGYGYYVLKKDDGGSVTAAYNPYEHSSNLVLNDQFESAYQRPNLVTVECIIPKSEMTSGYKAKYAKDSTGYLDWKAGTVAGKLKGNKRKVYLSRWLKPVRILSDAEVASMYKDILGSKISVPFNVVTPQLRAELEKVGVKIDYEGSPGYQYRQSKKATDDSTKYQERDSDSISNRSLLANALESAAKEGEEKNLLRNYKTNLRLLEAEQAKLADVRQKAYELRFKKGRTAEETKALNSLDFEAKQIATRINSYDRELLKIEAMQPIKAVLNREKQMAYKRAEQKGKEALKKQRERASENYKKLLAEKQESRKKAVESRHKTEMRHKIKKVVGDLNTLLLHPTKDNHVPIGLQLVVADALDAINMDTMNAAERVAYYNDRIAKSTNPDEIEMLTKKRDFFEYRDMNFKDKVTTLKNAYAEFKNSDDPLIRNAHNEAIANLIENTSDIVGKKSLKDMSYEQLEAVYNMYKAVLATVRNANKMFKEGRQETITENSEAVKTEVREVGGHQDRVLKKTKFLKKFGWDMLKPITAMKVIGSDTLASLFDNVRAGEDTWAVDVSEAKAFYADVAAKYKYKDWDFKKRYSFKDSAGHDFSLSLEQIMSLYAYSKRDQADRHLEVGGFIFDDAIEVTEKGKLGIPMKYEVNDANPYRLRREDLNIVIDSLSNEQKGFIDEMQSYLSDVMGAKGNEVSLAMYDIKLYNEKNYFPLKTSRYFREFDPEKSATPKIKNAGFSKKTVPQAGNPIVLSNFMDVWADHVNDMSMYHAFVLPLEDFTRVYNYSSTAGGYDSVQQYIKNAYGAQANQYVEKLLDDLNGGARVDSSAGVINKGLSLFKKASVFASASVVIQQPSAIARAFAYINPKYFAEVTGSALNLAKHRELWAEVKKYAPVAVIKEMGYFDTGIGRSSVDWIKGNQTIMDKADDVLSKAPAIADELAWSHIWLAVKREVKATTNLKEGSEEFLKKAGKRFTEIIVNTQVYDSVLSRSAFMRSKDTGVKMATAFMAEPTTTVNMVVDGIIQGKRGNKKFVAATLGAVASSVILNSLLVSIVYAMRDDDEDETYAEKYLGSLTSELLDGFNPITYIPWLKDAWSILQGFDVERADMTIVTKLVDSLQQVVKVIAKDTDDMNEDELVEYRKEVNEAVLSVADNGSSLFGIPFKNLRRDINAVINLVRTLIRGDKTTANSLGDTLADSAQNATPVWGWLPDKSTSDKLYDAIINGDTAYVDRLKRTYKDDDAVVSAIRKALRENDPRIKEAAQADFDGDIAEYNRIINAIISEGNFTKADILAAFKSERNDLEPDDEKDDSPAADKDVSIYNVEQYFTAIKSGNTSLANTAKDDIIKTAVANGKSLKDAESSFYSSFRKVAKDAYADGSLSRSEAERLLTNYGNLDGDDAYWTLKEWDYFKQNGTTDGYSKYSNFYDAVQTGVNLKAVISEYTSHGVEAKTLASQITSYFKPLYKEMYTHDRASLKGYLLNAYVQLGYSRSEKNKDINAWLKD